MKKTRKFIKSANDEDEMLDSQETPETDSQESEDAGQFEADEDLIDSISDAEEFAGTNISKEDIIDAIQAIDVLADAVLEKSDTTNVDVDADSLLDQIEEIIDAPTEDNFDIEEDVSEEDAEFEMEEDEELPEELANAVVRVMISEDGATTVESNPDSIYNADIDGLDCTVYDTCDDVSLNIEDDGESKEDDVLVIGNSKAKNFKKGFVVLKSSANKRCWSAAVKKVRKMVGSSKLTAAHWVIVSALATKMAKEDMSKKVVQSKVLKVIKNNKIMKNRLNKIIKSDAEFDNAGATNSDIKVENTVGEEVGYKEDGEPTSAKSPEEVDSTYSNPVEDPKMQYETEGEYMDIPDAPIQELEVTLFNSKRNIKMKKISSSKRTGKTMYIVQNANTSIRSALDGKVIPVAKNCAFIFKNTSQGLLGCACRFERVGKGRYDVCLKNNRFVITIGKPVAVFANAEKVIVAQKIASARAQGVREGKAQATRLYSGRIAQMRKNSERQISNAKRIASAGERELRTIHAEQERERLFQSSQKQINEEKILIKENNTRNANSLNKLYSKMF